jgi:hypothetical protein
MRPQSEDTDLRAEMVQIDLLRKSTISQRVSMALSLSETVIRLARKAICLQNPHLGDRDALLCFVAIHYGPGLAKSITNNLERRSG